ncbi:hypothetical protein B0T22DRAFT_56998 [Podospora appendiculata]|uniref:Uncharacterized protein n=1 Tax=Podospora appendiculata TaxID=314037 RepID=A0AAE0XIK8_9PEZI|nr:hypothetical protein B0T22DRAFT_56998 [Podospora appendiculata]
MDLVYLRYSTFLYPNQNPSQIHSQGNFLSFLRTSIVTRPLFQRQTKGRGTPAPNLTLATRLASSPTNGLATCLSPDSHPHWVPDSSPPPPPAPRRPPKYPPPRPRAVPTSSPSRNRSEPQVPVVPAPVPVPVPVQLGPVQPHSYNPSRSQSQSQSHCPVARWWMRRVTTSLLT